MAGIKQQMEHEYSRLIDDIGLQINQKIDYFTSINNHASIYNSNKNYRNSSSRLFIDTFSQDELNMMGDINSHVHEHVKILDKIMSINDIDRKYKYLSQFISK